MNTILKKDMKCIIKPQVNTGTQVEQGEGGVT